MNLRNALFLILIALFGLSPALAADAANPELSGVYGDEGTVVATAPVLFTGEVSLHALLRLEFDPKLVRLRSEQAAEVKLKRAGALLEVEITDGDGEVSWKSQLKVADGKSDQGRVALLRMRDERFGTDEFIIVLEPLPSGLLQVQVRRLAATVLGPVERATGTYLFPRIQ